MDSGIIIKVTSLNDFDPPMEDRFDGVPYVFDKGRAVPVPLEAAILFFGFPVDPQTGEVDPTPDRAYVCRRYGWNTPDHLKAGTARAYFENLKFAQIRQVVTEEEVGDDRLPAPRVSAPERVDRIDVKQPPRRRTLTPEQRERNAENLRIGRETARQNRLKKREAARGTPETVA